MSYSVFFFSFNLFFHLTPRESVQDLFILLQILYVLVGLAETAHVVQEKGAIYNAVLGLVDVVRGTNSYYKIQALESDKSSS